MTNEQQPMAHEAAGSAEPVAGPGSCASQTGRAPSANRIPKHIPDYMPERKSNRTSNCALEHASVRGPDPTPKRESGRMSNHIPECEPDCMPEREPRRRSKHIPRRASNQAPNRMPMDKPRHPVLRNARMLGNILRHTGFAHITAIFGVLFLFCSLMVWLADPGCLTFGDGMWFSFEAVSTIGFGDIEAAGPIARAATVVLSIFSIFYIALITGVVVNYCSNLIKARQKDTLANFIDSLEHLEEKSPEELAELSDRVREYVAKR